MTQNPWLLTCLCLGRDWRRQLIPVSLAVLLHILPAEAQRRVVTTGEFVERNGVTRAGTLVEQGIPVPPMSAVEAGALRLERMDGKPLLSRVEPEGGDEKGRVVWVRASAVVAMPSRGRLPVRLVGEGLSNSVPEPAVRVDESAEGVVVTTSSYRLTADKSGQIELKATGQTLLSGPWSVELEGDARAVLWGAYFRPFEARSVVVQDRAADRVTVLLRGIVAKNQRKAPGSLEPGRRFDCELRLHASALSPVIRFDWRITNLTGTKTWLQRYALRLPLSGPSQAERTGADRLLALTGNGGRLSVTADFIDDLGKGAGIELSADRKAVFAGGLAMPPDGTLYQGVPEVHRLFYLGMSRTFGGALVPGGSAEPTEGVDLVLPAQYYSSTGALPEKGDPVTFGEFRDAVMRSAEWLLAKQWRGTLFWGEWYREWDETRNMGVQEAHNGHSPLAPLYHYWRTGDARFLQCARRSAQFVYDVQLFKGEDGQGRMFQTRRHLFDELDWIHPRYQRATGGLVSSHVFLDSRARNEIVETIRSFHQHMFDAKGVPHDWDKAANRRGEREDGVDTSNFMEALTYCYRETGDRTFLDWALQMSRWTGERFALAGKREGDDWNWNLTNYALRGLVTLYETSGDEFVKDLALRMCRATVNNQANTIAVLRDGVGGGELHFVFYHAWISMRVAKFAPDRDEIIGKLLTAVRREVARLRPDGTFVLDHGVEAGSPTRWISYYDAKALVAYVPTLAAHLATKPVAVIRRGPAELN
ncbi:MAG: hypothetical protein ABIZ80_07085 [Bryobacteraceae bacterium]